MDWNHELTKEQKTILEHIKDANFSDKDFRSASLKALRDCCEDDMLMVLDSAERIVRYVKTKNPRFQMSLDGAIELLAAIGRLLMTPAGRTHIREVEEKNHVRAEHYYSLSRSGKVEVSENIKVVIPDIGEPK